MPQPPRPLPAADPLGESLHLLRLTGTLYCRAELGAPWGVEVPPLDSCMVLIVVTAGRCLLDTGATAPRTLEAGSVALLTRGAAHTLRSAAGDPVVPLFDIPVDQVSDRYEVMRVDGGGAITRVTYAVLSVESGSTRRLVEQLPEAIQVDAWGDASAGAFHDVLRIVAAEAETSRPGGETVMTRLADVLVVQLVRSWLDHAPEARLGWIAALRDPHLGRVLGAVHQGPGLPWSLQLLAREARMSRSAFAARFAELVGTPPMRYVTAWRLQVAHDPLTAGADPLPVIAQHVGYLSEAAFCRAFRREYGVSPGSLRRAKDAA
ncbi:AraC family transcriptional regulator [Cellulomonas timonensis]|uniref:AraC family transcriptional regulator n=1 Tax=Cellulomonas timonensis TaxID=1689271 RepID=UPI0008362624|nr:AraC family transcriptional regulator [Cellulomonas timonensis]